MSRPAWSELAPNLPSFITGLCSRCGPTGTGLRTRLVSGRRGSCAADELAFRRRAHVGAASSFGNRTRL
jgi:hypothetical protein